MKQIVFIIGGFGTHAGIDILHNLISQYETKKSITTDSDHINFNMLSTTIGTNHMTYDDSKTSFMNVMNHIECFARMNVYGKIYVCIGCNTMHMCLEDYKIPSDITNVLFFKLPFYIKLHLDKIYTNEKIYLWSTKETYESKLYHRYVNPYTIEEFDMYDTLNHVICLLKQSQHVAIETINKLLENIPDHSIIILGCTELPLLLHNLHGCIQDRKITLINPNSIVTDYITDVYIKHE